VAAMGNAFQRFHRLPDSLFLDASLLWSAIFWLHNLGKLFRKVDKELLAKNEENIVAISLLKKVRLTLGLKIQSKVLTKISHDIL